MNQANPNPAIPSWDEIRQMIRETSIQMKETDRRMQVTDRLIKETGLQMKETDRRMQETDRMIKENKEGLKETRALLDDIKRRSDERTKELDKLFNIQWNNLIESLSSSEVLALFEDIGIDIDIDRSYSGMYTCQVGGIDKIELDTVLCGNTVAVVVGVRNEFCRSDVKELQEKMKTVKKYFPEFADKQLYAATAAIKYNESSDTIAQKRGMFVIHTSGDGVFSLTEPKKREVF